MVSAPSAPVPDEQRPDMKKRVYVGHRARGVAGGEVRVGLSRRSPRRSNVALARSTRKIDRHCRDWRSSPFSEGSFAACLRARLSAYIEASACCMIVSTLSPHQGYPEMPSDAVSFSVRPSSSMRSVASSAFWRRLTMTSAALSDVSGRMIANSSPPIRAGTSLARVCSSRKCPKLARTSSPTRWPYVSLTALSWSTSTRSDGHRALEPPSGLQFPFQALEEVAAVEELREVVTHGHVLKLHVVHEEIEPEFLFHVDGHAAAGRRGSKRVSGEAAESDCVREAYASTVRSWRLAIHPAKEDQQDAAGLAATRCARRSGSSAAWPSLRHAPARESLGFVNSLSPGCLDAALRQYVQLFRRVPGGAVT